MAQKKYGAEGPARPRHLSETQVELMTSGTSVEDTARAPEDHDRPRAISEKDVATLAKGGGVNLEEVPPVADIEMAERPVHLEEKDVEALLQGKEVKLEERPRLKAQ
jgi:hypothetical protein